MTIIAKSETIEIAALPQAPARRPSRALRQLNNVPTTGTSRTITGTLNVVGLQRTGPNSTIAGGNWLILEIRIASIKTAMAITAERTASIIAKVRKMIPRAFRAGGRE